MLPMHLPRQAKATLGYLSLFHGSLFYFFLLIVQLPVAPPPAPHEVRHIGKAIKEVFDRQPRSCTATWFARQINCHRANVYDIFSRPSIDCELLERISTALNHNFFLDLADDMQRETDSAGHPPPSG